jgi:hypothetical protein
MLALREIANARFQDDLRKRALAILRHSRNSPVDIGVLED